MRFHLIIRRGLRSRSFFRDRIRKPLSVVTTPSFLVFIARNVSASSRCAEREPPSPPDTAPPRSSDTHRRSLHSKNHDQRIIGMARINRGHTIWRSHQSRLKRKSDAQKVAVRITELLKRIVIGGKVQHLPSKLRASGVGGRRCSRLPKSPFGTGR